VVNYFVSEKGMVVFWSCQDVAVGTKAAVSIFSGFMHSPWFSKVPCSSEVCSLIKNKTNSEAKELSYGTW
jgi:hypothetical protein